MNHLRATFGEEPHSLGSSGEVSNWCSAPGKRIFDLLCTIPVLIVFAPLMLLIAAAVRLSSGSPVLFRQKRFGRDGSAFECMKFRTMTISAGAGVTQAGDARVTRLGRVLRKWKLDELPQLVNVIRGDMSLVGPRPDLPEFIAGLDIARRRSLSLLTPGITGWATLHFRHEEELLAKIPPDELQSYYVQQVMPQKIELDLEYASRATLWSDLMVLLRTVKAIL